MRDREELADDLGMVSFRCPNPWCRAVGYADGTPECAWCGWTAAADEPEAFDPTEDRR